LDPIKKGVKEKKKKKHETPQHYVSTTTLKKKPMTINCGFPHKTISEKNVYL